MWKRSVGMLLMLAKKNRMSGNANYPRYQGEGACQASGNSSRHVTNRGTNNRQGQANRPNRQRKFEDVSFNQRDEYEYGNTSYPYQDEGAHQGYGTYSASEEYNHTQYRRSNDRHWQSNKTRKYNEFRPNQRGVHGNANKSKNSSLLQKAMQEFEFFWGSNFAYSQFYPCEFTVDGITFNCTEQFMMYSKAMLFKDKDIAEKVLKETDPLRHKKLGRQVKYFNQKTWDAHCSAIVERGNKAKFSQNAELKAIIVKTHPKTIVETSPHDKIWGIGLHKNDPLAWDRSTWKGLNLLGQALTKVRDEIIKEVNEGARDEIKEEKNKGARDSIIEKENEGARDEIKEEKNKGARDEIIEKENKGASDQMLKEENEDAKDEIIKEENEGARDEIIKKENEGARDEIIDEDEGARDKIIEEESEGARP
ncbi:uncharacterized protein LOC134696787 isoform X2 [Mytilus trossulus]|uniref:uncharacterized protein LOC134696787 isoform X2 n=1 Tax=Mytilus trossulus TaxID=6551 RepID=UPI0030064392